jgi:hypothetical protein
MHAAQQGIDTELTNGKSMGKETLWNSRAALELACYFLARKKARTAVLQGHSIQGHDSGRHKTSEP